MSGLAALAVAALFVSPPTFAPQSFAERASAFAAELPAAHEEADAESDDALAGAEDAPVFSQAAARVLDWVAASGDNGELPYIVIDKKAARLFLFDASGKSLGDAPVLLGIAEGDESSPGIGSKKLAELGPAEKTTPAGRFVAKYGWAAGREKVLWVDYATSVALHAVITGNKKERRQERLDTPTVEDNRISFGCINVPTEFYKKQIRPLFKDDGGVVYVLPEVKPLEEVFPRLHAHPYQQASLSR